MAQIHADKQTYGAVHGEFEVADVHETYSGHAQASRGRVLVGVGVAAVCAAGVAMAAHGRWGATVTQLGTFREKAYESGLSTDGQDGVDGGNGPPTQDGVLIPPSSHKNRKGGVLMSSHDDGNTFSATGALMYAPCVCVCVCVCKHVRPLTLPFSSPPATQSKTHANLTSIQSPPPT